MCMRMVKVTAWGWCSVSSPCKPKLVSHLKTFLKKCYYFNAINNDHDNDADTSYGDDDDDCNELS